MKNMPEDIPNSTGDCDGNWVCEVLDPDQLSRSKPCYGKRPLGGGILVLLWALRLYVILMILLIAYQIWKTFPIK